MAQARVKVIPNRRLERFLKRLDPQTQDSVSRLAMTDMVNEMQANAAEVQIDRGRGRHAPTLPRKLTFRSGLLAGGISTAIGRLPKSAEFGAIAKYAPIHERGLGRFPKRPFLLPAAEYVKAKLARQIWNRRLAEATR